MLNETVLYINNFAGPGLGGGERHLGSLAAGAREAGWRVVIACLPGSDVGVWLGGQGHEIVDFNPGDPNLLQTMAQLRQIIIRERVAIVHAHGFWPGNVARAAVRLPATLKPRPVVVTTIHCQPNSIMAGNAGLVTKLKLGLRRRLDKLTARWGDIFIAVSKDIENQLIAQGVLRERVVLIYNGIDAVKMRTLAQSDQASEDSRIRRIGVVARLEPVKGIEDLIQAFSLIAGDFPDLKLVIVGGGPLASQLEEEVRELSLVDRVEFTGYLENPLPRVLGFDIYVLPSRSEGLNVTLLEAMALERAVIATDVGGNSELVDDGITGKLVPTCDPRSLARVLTEMLNGPEQTREFGLAGAERVREKFSAEAMSQEVLAIYDRLRENTIAN